MIPAIDLINGQVVRLKQGDYQQQTTYDLCPLAQLTHYQQQGADYLHLVDLDGAKDPNARQHSLLSELAQALNAGIQVGGGVRTLKDAEALLQTGVKRVVVGSTAIKNPQHVKTWFNALGADSLVLALDTHITNPGTQQERYLLPTDGWTQGSGVALQDLLESYLEVGVQHVLCTDISKDGMLQGPNLTLYQKLVASYPQIQWQASGGVAALSDIGQLKSTGVSGAILGKALLENRFSVEEAKACWQNA